MRGRVSAMKTLERVILNYLLRLDGVRDTITRNQHAYMTGSSTESTLHALVSRLEQGIVEGRFLLAIFLDIQGAFNNLSYIHGSYDRYAGCRFM